MLNRMIEYSLRNRLLVLTISVLLTLSGYYVTRDIEIDVFPDLNAPTVVVMTEARGMAPEEVERLVTFPIETSVNGASGVRRVRSSSAMGFSVVWVEFDWGTNIYTARQIVSEKLSSLEGALPEQAGRPVLGPQSSILGEIMIIGLTSDSTSLQDLRTIADWNIRPRLLSTGGVAQVTVIGGDLKEYQILLDQNRMKHYGISLDEILPSLENMNRNATGGVLNQYGNEYIIRGMMSTSRPEELGKALIRQEGSPRILLENIAEVKTGNKTPRSGIASERGRPAVLLTITKQSGVNTLELTEKLDQAIEEIKVSLPTSIQVSTDAFRQARFIEQSISNIQKALMEGSVFVLIVLFAFLRNGRTTLISLITLPISLFVAILVLRSLGLTLNTMSLGGMAIAIGSLVDDAIVDVENVWRRVRENRLKPEEERLNSLTVVSGASKEVRMPILHSTLIIVAGFLPLFFLNGFEGRMLIPLGIAFIVSLFASTLIALTLTPVLCSYLLTDEKILKKNEKEPAFTRIVHQIYQNALTQALRHKKIWLGVTGGVLGITLVLFFSLGRSFLPPFNEGSLTIQASTLPGISLEESDRTGRMAEKILMEIPEVQTVTRKTGRAELDEHALGVNNSELEVPFQLRERSREAFLAEVRSRLSILKGLRIEIGQPISHRIDMMLSGSKANIAIKIFGPDLSGLYSAGNQIKEKISGIEGLVDLTVEQQVERPQLQIRPKREMLARYGISLPEFSELIEVALTGKVISQVYEEGKSFDLTVKFSGQEKKTIESVGDLMLDAGGKKIPLSYVADILSVTGPNTIQREDVGRKIVVSANITGGDLNGIVKKIQTTIHHEVILPEGYYVEYGGQFENQQSASKTLLLTSLFSLLLIFLILYQEFKSLSTSAIILINLPLALIGGVFMLKFTSGIISIPAIIGFISLFGIATRNGLLLVSRYEQLRKEGYGLRECVIRGSCDRLNPILMTALSSALALIPLAMGGELPGNEIQSPLAQVVLGGLLSATLLNGFIIPIVYTLMYSKTRSL